MPGQPGGRVPSYSTPPASSTLPISPPGPFAPNSVISIFGTGLARSIQAIGPSDIKSGSLPLELNYVRVYDQDQPAPMLFVSTGQINFVMPSIQVPGVVRVRVVVEGATGPEITLTLVDAAPALFPLSGDYIIATSADGKLLTTDAPAQANDTVVIYCSGLGQSNPNPPLSFIPTSAAQMTAFASLKSRPQRGYSGPDSHQIRRP